MNTRQKLTLGIAAIFMVTLTIVGVTYAYFFTRVNVGGTDTTDIEASTAKIESIKYLPEEDTAIKVNDILPGAPAIEKEFQVQNPNETQGSFELFLTTAVPANEETTDVLDDLLPSFIHAKATDFDSKVCYDNETTETAETVDTYTTVPADCYTGDLYDNIVFTLLDSNGDAVAQDSLGNVIEEQQKVRHNANLTDGNEQVIGTFNIAGGATDTYTLKVEYLNKETPVGYNNQNLEFNAALNIKVNIR